MMRPQQKYAAAAQCLLSKASSGRLFEEKPTHCFAVAGTEGMVAAATFTQLDGYDPTGILHLQIYVKF